MTGSLPTRAGLLRLIQERGGATLASLQQATGLSRSALRQHMTILERDGLIRERLARGKAGRPPIVYEPAPVPPLPAAKSYVTLLGAVLRAVEEQGEGRLSRVVGAVAAEIAEQHRDISTIPEAPARIRAALELLWEDARTAQLRPGGRQYEIILPDCPLASLASEFNEICDITRELLATLVGAEVQQREWLVRGDARCSFVLRLSASSRDSITSGMDQRSVQGYGRERV